MREVAVSAVPISGGWRRATWDVAALARGGALVVIVVVLAWIAAREYVFSHALAVFATLGAITGLAVAATGRPVTVAAGLAAATLLVDAINSIKVDHLEENLHVVDLFVLRDYMTGGDLVLFWTYLPVFWRETALLALGAAAFAGLALWERRLPGPPFRARLGAILAFAVATVVTTHLLWTGPRLATITRLPFAMQLTARLPLQTSFILRTVADFGRMSDELGRDALTRPLAATTPCPNCPDLVIVHVESVFDPAMLAGHGTGPRIGDAMANQLGATTGSLRTNVFGGNSLISEFEIHCQINHKILGMAGLYPPLFMRPHVRRCAPDYLREKGYETHIVYSVDPQYNYARATYRTYGLDHFYGPDDFGMPKNWLELRDSYLVDAALSILAKPRARPRLVILATISNHGPHGAGLVPQVFPGPFRAVPGDSPQIADYLNRLNDSVAQFQRLEQRIAATRVPTALLYYGDHQPGFDKSYAPEIVARFGAASKFVTFWRMARTYGGKPAATEGPYLKLESLVGHFFDFAGVKLSPEQYEARRIVAGCEGAQDRCEEGERRKLRSLFLR